MHWALTYQICRWVLHVRSLLGVPNLCLHESDPLLLRLVLAVRLCKTILPVVVGVVSRGPRRALFRLLWLFNNGIGNGIPICFTKPVIAWLRIFIPVNGTLVLGSSRYFVRTLRSFLTEHPSFLITFYVRLDREGVCVSRCRLILIEAECGFL